MLVGDKILFASMITYGGIFSNELRAKLQREWQELLEKANIPCTNKNIREQFGNENTIKIWKESACLPSDRHSIENAIILEKTRKCSFIIDPQNQCNKYIKELAKVQGETLVVLNNGSLNMQTIESAVQEGKWILIEKFKGKLEQCIEPILNHNYEDEFIRFGGATLPFNKNFRLFVTTTEEPSRCSSKHFANMNVINFSLTPGQLEEQLLSTYKNIEKKDEEKIKAVVSRASLLYFCLQDLSLIDPMYRNSLQWFRKFFAEANKEDLTNSFKQKIEPSLFSSHKLVFSFLIAARTVYGINAFEKEELKEFVSSFSGSLTAPENPTTWIEENIWPSTFKKIYGLSTLKAFEGFDEYFMNNSEQFKKIFESNNPHKQAIPTPWEKKLNAFQKILLLKAFRPDKVIVVLKEWIGEQLGKEFL